MTLAEIKAQADTWLAGTLWPLVQTKQAAHLARYGCHWQGLLSHGAIPADGAQTTPTVGNAVPTAYQVVDSTIVDPNVSKLVPVVPWPPAWQASPWPAAVQMTQYDGPQGKGYVGTVWVTVLGQTYTRSQNSGPETWRTQPWTQVS